MFSLIRRFLFGKKQPAIRKFYGILEANGTFENDWLPGCEFVTGKAVIAYHVWGIARAGSSDVGERDFIEDGPQVAVTEVRDVTDLAASVWS